jgi:TPR repeat protein
MLPMTWGNLRSWWVISGLVLVVAALTAVPMVLKSAHVGWPTWLVTGFVVLAGVLLTVWKPLLSTRSDALTARTKIKVDQQARAEAMVRGLPSRKGHLLRVEQVISRAVLNIHEAIPLPAGSEMGLSADLPQYVTRDIDADLRTFLTARSSTGGFALLIGPAAAGKTRTAYEAVRHVMPRWRMLMPSTGTELNELVANRADLTRSVIWLNETQDFLTSSDPLTAATVRRLLADTARPVILIGTIWPDHYDQLRTMSGTALPATADNNTSPLPVLGAAPGQGAARSAGNEADAEGVGTTPRAAESPRRNARDVLDQARPFPMPRFSHDEWQRAIELAPADPRLEEAARHRHGGLGLTQILSAAPQLIHRWEQADTPYGQAVLTAAVTARRCGHPDTIPETVLEAMAAQLLTGHQRATAPPDWFPRALIWACRPLHHTGGIAPLRPHAQTIRQVDGYRVTDILTNHTAPTAPATAPDHLPDTLWNTLITAAAPDACFRIGYAANTSNRSPQTTTAWTRAAEAGDTHAMTGLGLLVYQQGDTDSAHLWLTRAAESGDTYAIAGLGLLLYQQGDTDGARTRWTQAARQGSTSAMGNLGSLLSEQGDIDGATTWYAQAAEAGDTHAMGKLGSLLSKQGDIDGARTWWTRAAEAGRTHAMVGLASILFEDGDVDGARTWWTQAAEAGDTTGMVGVGLILREQGDIDGARTWWTQAAQQGNLIAVQELGSLPCEHCDIDGATTSFTRATQASDTDAAAALAELRDDETGPPS